MDIKKIIEELVDTFLKAGELSILLRDENPLGLSSLVIIIFTLFKSFILIY